MRVLITGAAGFIGNALACRLVANGHRVTAIIRDGTTEADCDVVNGDLRDLPTVERAMVYAEADAVFHLAAQAIVPYARRDPWNTFEDNVRGTYNLLEAFRRHGKAEATCVVASSDKAYGELQGRPLYRETDPLAGRGPYDCSKSCTDLIAQSYAAEYALRIGVVRAGNVYGPGDTHPTRLIPSIVEDIVSGVEPVIQSDGRPIRDFLYIDDAVEGYLAVERYFRGLTHEQLRHGAEPWIHPAFNLSGREPISVLDLVLLADEAAQVVGLAPNEDPVILGKRTGEIAYQALDTHLARTVLKWAPQVTLFEGLQRTIRAEAVRVGRIAPQSDTPTTP